MSLVVVGGIALAIGALSGLRAFTPIALICWLAIWGWIPVAGSPLWFLGTTTSAIILTVAAIGELIADKFSHVPPRTGPGPLGARVVTGGLAAGALCFVGGRPWWLGFLLGGCASVAGAFAGYHVRRWLKERLHIRDFLVAVPEDLITIAGTAVLVRLFFSTSI